MSNAIQYLENLGRNPGAQRKVAAVPPEIESAQQQALMSGDVEGLRDLLGGRERMVCAVATPDEAEFQEEESRRDPAH